MQIIPIKGTKITYHNASTPNEPVSERVQRRYPWKIVIDLSPPEFMRVTFVLMVGGCETLEVRGKSREALVRFIRKNDFTHHPRLLDITIMSPDGDEEVFDRRNASALLQPS